MVESEELRSPDWVWSNNSNVSTAKDRGWFLTYTPFVSHCENNYFSGPPIVVKGIGTVEIPVRLPSKRAGRKHGTLRIHDVLHIPNATCNILGQGDFMHQKSISCGPRSTGSVKDQSGKILACWDEKKPLFCLKLSGPPVGPRTAPSMFSGDAHYVISISWPDSERARWNSMKPYTEAEKAWVKKMFSDEFHFLRQYGLAIHDDEDRMEGRTILRQLMENDSESEESPNEKSVNADQAKAEEGEIEDEDEEFSGSDSEDSFLQELEDDPMSHVADCHFSAKQLDWIKKHYGNSGKFLRCHGLKPFDDEDCEEGETIVAAFMAEA